MGRLSVAVLPLSLSVSLSASLCGPSLSDSPALRNSRRALELRSLHLLPVSVSLALGSLCCQIIYMHARTRAGWRGDGGDRDCINSNFPFTNTKRKRSCFMAVAFNELFSYLRIFVFV